MNLRQRKLPIEKHPCVGLASSHCNAFIASFSSPLSCLAGPLRSLMSWAAESVILMPKVLRRHRMIAQRDEDTYEMLEE